MYEIRNTKYRFTCGIGFNPINFIDFMNDLKELYDNVVTQFAITKTPNSTKLISQYIGDDWKRYIEFSDITYKRNIISELSNDDIEFVLICWNDGQCITSA